MVWFDFPSYSNGVLIEITRRLHYNPIIAAKRDMPYKVRFQRSTEIKLL